MDINNAQDAIAALKEQLDWRSPSGREMGHIVFRRDKAMAMLSVLEKLQDVRPGTVKGMVYGGGE